MSTNVTLKFVHRTSKARDDGRAPIYLRITANRKSRFKTTGILVRPKHWNEGRHEVRKSHELASAYNDKLRRIRLTAEEAVLDASSAEEVKAAVEGTKGSLTKYFEEYIEGLDRRDQFWQKRKFETTLRETVEQAVDERLPEALEEAQKPEWAEKSYVKNRFGWSDRQLQYLRETYGEPKRVKTINLEIV